MNIMGNRKQARNNKYKGNDGNVITDQKLLI